MRKAFIFLFVSFLAGCSRDIFIPNEKLMSPLQGTSPDMCLPVEPSSQALAQKGINFENIADQIRYDIKYNSFVPKLQNLKRVHVDYTILPATESSSCIVKDKKGGKAVRRLLSGQPKRYYMKMSFYKCPKAKDQGVECKDKKKACETESTEPDFEETITMAVDLITPFEAYKMLAREIIIDQTVSPLKKLQVDLGGVY